MKIRFFAFCVLLAAATVSSCKKDEDSSSMIFGGTLSFEFPSYIQQGKDYEFTPGKITRDEKDKDLPTIKMYYSLDKGTQTDTIFNVDLSKEYKFKFHASDGEKEIGNHTLSVNAYAEGYTLTSYSTNIIYVDPTINGKSLNGLDFNKDTPFFPDKDGRKYYTVEINGKTWMKQNYAGSSSGASYMMSPIMDNLFGRYYSWNEAQKVCPEGWHLSTPEEWNDLAAAFGCGAGVKFGEEYKGLAGKIMVDAIFNKVKMWEYWPKVKITNETGFSALPVGFADVQTKLSNNSFTEIGSFATFWTSGEHEDCGDYMYIIGDEYDTVCHGLADKDTFLASVRCVMN